MPCSLAVRRQASITQFLNHCIIVRLKSTSTLEPNEWDASAKLT